MNYLPWVSPGWSYGGVIAKERSNAFVSYGMMLDLIGEEKIDIAFIVSIINKDYCGITINVN